MVFVNKSFIKRELNCIEISIVSTRVGRHPRLTEDFVSAVIINTVTMVSSKRALLQPAVLGLLLLLVNMAASSYAENVDVVVGGFVGDETIALGTLDMQTGALKLHTFSKAAGRNPDFFAWQKNQQGAAVTNILVTNEASEAPGITALQLQRQPATSAGSSSSLKAIQTAALPVDEPTHVAMHPSNRWAFSASYSKGTVTVIELVQVTGLQQGTAKGGPAAQSPQLLLRKASVLPTSLVGDAAHQVVLAGPRGNLVYVPSLKSNYVRMYKFDESTGRLSPNNYSPAGNSNTKAQASSSSSSSSSPNKGSSSSSSTNSKAGSLSVQPGDNKVFLPPGSGPRHMVVHPNLPVAYVLNELTSTIARFDWDAASGGHLVADLSQQPGRIVSMLPAGSSCSNAGSDAACKGRSCLQAGAELLLSADGKFLYASNRGQCGGSNSIVVFAVSSTDGSLKPLAWEDAGGDIKFPRHMSLTPDERNTFLLVANQDGGSVTVLRRDASTGLLKKVTTVPTAAADGSAAVKLPAFVAVV